MALLIRGQRVAEMLFGASPSSSRSAVSPAPRAPRSNSSALQVLGLEAARALAPLHTGAEAPASEYRITADTETLALVGDRVSYPA